MPLYHFVDNRLVPADELFLTVPKPVLSKCYVNLPESGTRSKSLATPPQGLVLGGDPANPFKPVGIGLPLSVEVRHIYNGKHAGGVFGSGSDFLLTSAVKSFETQGAIPRALNRLAANLKPRSYIEFSAAEPGTPIVYYSPAIASYGTLVTIELSRDRFRKETVDAAAELLRDAGALPVFASAGAYLLGASAVVKVAGSVFENILDRTPFLRETISIAFDAAGLPNFAAGYYVLAESADKTALETEAVLGPDGQMKDKSNPSKRYEGDIPYVVVAVDGRSRSPVLDGFSVKAAEAALLERFMKAGTTGQSLLRDLDTAMKLYNDYSYRKKLDETDAELNRPSLSQTEKDALLKARDAYAKNIKSKEFQPPN